MNAVEIEEAISELALQPFAETTQVALQARQKFLDAISQRLMQRIPFGVAARV